LADKGRESMAPGAERQIAKKELEAAEKKVAFLEEK